MTPVRLALDAVLVAIIAAIVWFGVDIIWMPGQSFTGTQPALTEHEKEIETHLRANEKTLATEIGLRRSAESLAKTIAWIKQNFLADGLKVEEQKYNVDRTEFVNIEGELKGTESPEKIVIVCAHYDTVFGSPGANDNGSGTAAVVELARLITQAGVKAKCTMRFVLFSTEEPPYFSSTEMGSYAYAARCKQRGENIVGVVVLETFAYYTDAPDSQRDPSFFVPGLPSKGNFVGFVANKASRKLVEKCIGEFRRTTPFPSEGVAAPEWFNGVDWADQYWFWKLGYPAVMVTDTAPYRYPHYHEKSDTPDKLTFPAFARAVGGMEKVVLKLAAE